MSLDTPSVRWRTARRETGDAPAAGAADPAQLYGPSQPGLTHGAHATRGTRAPLGADAAAAAARWTDQDPSARSLTDARGAPQGAPRDAHRPDWGAGGFGAHAAPANARRFDDAIGGGVAGGETAGGGGSFLSASTAKDSSASAQPPIVGGRPRWASANTDGFADQAPRYMTREFAFTDAAADAASAVAHAGLGARPTDVRWPASGPALLAPMEAGPAPPASALEAAAAAAAAGAPLHGMQHMYSGDAAYPHGQRYSAAMMPPPRAAMHGGEWATSPYASAPLGSSAQWAATPGHAMPLVALPPGSLMPSVAGNRPHHMFGGPGVVFGLPGGGAAAGTFAQPLLPLGAPLLHWSAYASHHGAGSTLDPRAYTAPANFGSLAHASAAYDAAYGSFAGVAAGDGDGGDHHTAAAPLPMGLHPARAASGAMSVDGSGTNTPDWRGRDAAASPKLEDQHAAATGPDGWTHSGAVTSVAEKRARAEAETRALPYECCYRGCHERFAARLELDEHLAAHERDRPFKCTHPRCGKSFRHRNDLVRHVRVHTGERPYQCPVPGCGRRFKQRGHVTAHLSTHNGSDFMMRTRNVHLLY